MHSRSWVFLLLLPPKTKRERGKSGEGIAAVQSALWTAAIAIPLFSLSLALLCASVSLW
jgi:hypothetical protein